MFYTVVTQPGGKLSEPMAITSPTPGVDVSALGVKEMHQLLRRRARCLQAGFGATHPMVKTLDDIRDAYVARVGVGLYFKQMVGALGQHRTVSGETITNVEPFPHLNKIHFDDRKEQTNFDFTDAEALQGFFGMSNVLWVKSQTTIKQTQKESQYDLF